MYGLRTESCFDSAHFLTDYDGKCENLHGHRWRVVAYLCQKSLGQRGSERGMVVDFAVFKAAIREETDRLDHTFLIEEGSLSEKTVACLKEEGFELTFLSFRTTAENLAHYFFERLSARGFPVSRIDVYETPLNCASYTEG